MFNFKERRRDSRYPVTEQLSVRFNDNFLNGTECSDISLGGMCIVIEDKIDKKYQYGTVFLVQKYNEEVIFFESRFRKIWDNPVYVDRQDTRIGIKFLDIDTRNFDNLQKIISIQEEIRNKHHN